MREKLKNHPSLKLRRTKKKKITLIDLAETVDVLAKTMQKGFDGIDQRFDGIDQKFVGIDQRFDGIDQRFTAVDKRFDDLTLAVKNGFDEQGQRIDSIENRAAKAENGLDNFWTHTNKMAGDINKLKANQEETRSLVDNVYRVDVKDLKKRMAIVESKV